MDCLLQLAHQSEVHRLRLYHELKFIFPAGGGVEAVELFPTTEKSGPCLLLLRGVTLPPEAFTAWLYESGLNWAATRMYWLAPGPEACSREELVQQLVAAGPPPGPCRLQCFPRSMESGLADNLLDAGWSIHPVAFEHVLHVVELPTHPDACGSESGVWRLRDPAPKRRRPRKRRPAGSNRAAAGAGAPAAEGDCQPQDEAPGEQQQQQPAPLEQGAVDLGLRYRYTFQPAATLFRPPPDRPTRIPQELSKAAGKLAEALMVADCCRMGARRSSLEGAGGGAAGKDGSAGTNHSSMALGAAIDLGAAPGGWTAMLAQRAKRVIAIDPAELDPRALLPNVTHLRCKAQEASAQVAALLGPGGPVDLAVCDMNMHPELAVPMLRAVAPMLREGGLLVLTLKFFGQGRDRDAWQAKMEALLAPEWRGVRVVHLLANTQHERTCLAVRSGVAA